MIEKFIYLQHILLFFIQFQRVILNGKVLSPKSQEVEKSIKIKEVP